MEPPSFPPKHSNAADIRKLSGGAMPNPDRPILETWWTQIIQFIQKFMIQNFLDAFRDSLQLREFAQESVMGSGVPPTVN